MAMQKVEVTLRFTAWGEDTQFERKLAIAVDIANAAKQVVGGIDIVSVATVDDDEDDDTE